MSRQEILIDTKVQGLRSVEKLTEEIEDLGKASSKAGRQVDDLNAGVKKTSAAAKKAGPDLGDMASKFRAMGSAGTLAGDTLERLSVVTSSKLGMAIGGVTLGIAAFTGAVKLAVGSFKALSESMQRTIEAKKKIQEWDVEAKNVVETSQRLEKATADLTKTYDNFIFSATGGQKAIEALAIATEKFNGFAEGMGNRLELIFGVSLRGAANIVLLADSIDELAGAIGGADSAASAFEATLNIVKDVLADDSEVVAMNIAFDKLAIGAFDAAAGIRDAGSAVVDFFSERGKGLLNILTDPLKGKGAPKKRRRGGGGRRGPTEQVHPALQSFLNQGFDAGLAAPTVDDTARQELLAQLQDFETFLGQMIEVGEKLQEALPTEAEAEAAKFAETLRQAVYPAELMVAEGMIGLAETAAQAAGAFMVTGDAFKNFGDVVLDTFGSLSTQIGSFFIKTGIGMTLISPATGAGLIAAGLGLQVLGGALGAKGSGNRGSGGGGGGGGGAGVSGAVTREIQRSLRAPDAGGAVTNIEVVIAGRAIEPEMVHIIDDISRLRRSRGLARLGA